MSNLEILKNGTEKEKIFATSIETLAQGQGFYGRIITNLNKMTEEELTKTREVINEQNLKETIDVIFWLEQ